MSTTTHGIVDTRRRRVPQRLEQVLRVVGDTTNAMTGEQLREHMGHRAPVLHDVRDPRRRAQVVLENAEGARVVAHEVDAGDVDAHATRRLDAGDAPMEVCRARDEPARHDAVGQDLAGAVDVGEEVLERQHPLTHAGLDADPLGLVDDARHEVERERSFLTGERKRDALIAEGPVAGGTALLEVVARQGREHGVERFVGGPRAIGRGEHLVPCGPGPVAIKEVPHLLVSSDAALREGFGRLTGGARFAHSW